MPTPLDPVRQKAASARFVAFFRELEGAFLERDDVLQQVALGLLCREHVLLTGPPGTAKSQVASAVFERILDEDTGEPSLFARQFTESTVQTDLVGPIDFKTLTETGRTEHFTDEGMLGAVHAFLDEVFDGRDMLLRAALNVLHERELKQGTKITRGRFECALMASNRYLADVLEGSRDTLLAFVDRIAFVGFVPRGFADPKNLGAVLRRQVGGEGRAPLEAPLTIQDVDALQAAVESVYVSDAICQSLAALLELVDGELKGAARADPQFVPTRYLSTRTAVKSGGILRGLCVYDKLFRHPERPLEVRHEDLAGLRLHLLLSGPEPDAIARLFDRETDARERRQLAILRTEREIFDRCFAKLPPTKVEPRPVARTVPARPAGSAPPPAIAKAAGVAPLVVAPSPLEEQARVALATKDPARIAESVRALVAAARGGGAEAARAAELLEESVAALQAEALRAGLAASAEPKGAVVSAAAELGALAKTLEGATGATRGLSRWLRGRAVTILGDAAAYALGIPASNLEAMAGVGAGVSSMIHAEGRIEALEKLSAMRRELFADGIDPQDREAADAAWARGIAAAEDDVAILCDAALQDTAATSLSVRGAGQLAVVLADLRPDLDRVRQVERRLAALRAPGAAGTPLDARVLGPRVGALVAAALDRLDARDRDAFHRQIEGILDVLEGAGLSGVVAAKDWVTAAARVLARSEGEPRLRRAGPASDSPERAIGAELDYDGYRRLRGESARTSNAYVLGKIAVRVSKPGGEGSPAPLAALLAEVPEAVRDEAARLDFRRIERAIDYLEAWWGELDRGGMGGREVGAFPQGTLRGPHRSPPIVEQPAPEPDDERLRRIVRSRFFTVILDDSALVRFVLEARLVAELSPRHAEQAAALRQRIDALQERTRRRVLDLLQSRADAAWASTIGGPS